MYKYISWTIPLLMLAVYKKETKRLWKINFHDSSREERKQMMLAQQIHITSKATYANKERNMQRGICVLI